MQLEYVGTVPGSYPVLKTGIRLGSCMEPHDVRAVPQQQSKSLSEVSFSPLKRSEFIGPMGAIKINAVMFPALSNIVMTSIKEK